MTPPRFQRFTYTLVLQQIPAWLLRKFFDSFKVDLLAKNCVPPPASLETEFYCNGWAALLSKPETLPDSLVRAMDELVEQAAPANWSRLEAAVGKARVGGAPIDTSSSRESLALQVWLWSMEQKQKEGSADLSPPAPAPLAIASDAPESAPQADDSSNRQPSTKCIGKIARLPREVREQLNRRMGNDEASKDLVEWLNGLPEVQAVLAAEFGGRPITRQNLYDWRQYGFRDWQMRRSALDFLLNLHEEDYGKRLACPDGVPEDASAGGPVVCAPAAKPLIPSLSAVAVTEKLSLWVALRYAAAAQTLAASDEKPETELRRLREFCRDIVALRRGDLGAGRLSLEQARLAAEQAGTEAELEKRFWEWTRRPDIDAKLHPNRDPEQTRREVVRMLDRELLGAREPWESPDADPALLI